MFAPGAEKFLARAGQHDDMNVVVHARREDGVVELPVHLIAVGIGRRIVQLDDGNARLHRGSGSMLLSAGSS